MLRNQIENTTKIEKKIDRHDVESTGRHIMDFETGDEDLTEFDPDYCIIFGSGSLYARWIKDQMCTVQ